MNGPSGLCIDAANNVYVADSDNAVIREIVVAPVGSSSPIIYTVAGQFRDRTSTYGGDGACARHAHLHFPDGCSFDSEGNMYIADRGNNEIRVVIGTLAVTPPSPTGRSLPGTSIFFAGTPGAVPPGPSSRWLLRRWTLKLSGVSQSTAPSTSSSTRMTMFSTPTLATISLTPGAEQRTRAL